MITWVCSKCGAIAVTTIEGPPLIHPRCGGKYIATKATQSPSTQVGLLRKRSVSKDVALGHELLLEAQK